MLKLVKVIKDPDGTVMKLIFEDGRKIAETVAYMYKDRGVVCFSVQSGCKVGCKFCGTGQRFIADFTKDDMKIQIETALSLIGNRPKIQLMSMSMGEPMDNWEPLMFIAEWYLRLGYGFYVSTVGLDDPEIYKDFRYLGLSYNKFGLQFSLHYHDDKKRRAMFGNYSKLLPIHKIIEEGRIWTSQTLSPAYYNYICTGKETLEDAQAVYNLVEGMHLTCSVICNTGDFIKTPPDHAQRFANMIFSCGDNIDVSLFDPAGQDTIGGGCGQLLYVQKKLKGEK